MTGFEILPVGTQSRDDGCAIKGLRRLEIGIMYSGLIIFLNELGKFILGNGDILPIDNSTGGISDDCHIGPRSNNTDLSVGDLQSVGISITKSRIE